MCNSTAKVGKLGKRCVKEDGNYTSRQTCRNQMTNKKSQRNRVNGTNNRNEFENTEYNDVNYSSELSG